MPTESRYQLVIKGPPALVAKFRADERLWHVEPWLYRPHVREHDADAGRLVYHYADDYKRPGPSVAQMAASYPGLTLICEACDELGTTAGRTRYVGGVGADVVHLDPSELDWIEWDDSYGEE